MAIFASSLPLQILRHVIPHLGGGLRGLPSIHLATVRRRETESVGYFAHRLHRDVRHVGRLRHVALGSWLRHYAQERRHFCAHRS